MLKIYKAYANQGKIEIDDYIDFNNGRFDTGLNGFGTVYSGNLFCLRANYELQTLKSFREYIKSVKLEDGYIEDFTLFNPYHYCSLKEKYKDLPKDIETYEKYSLNEEAIILFTNYISLKDYNEKVTRIFGRYLPNSMYLLLPGAKLSMYTGEFQKDIFENYEVLQSDSLGKSLTLTKINRLDLK